MATHHKQLMPARSPFKDATVETVMATGNEKNIPVKFTDLSQHLKQKNFYEPVDLTEFIGEYESDKIFSKMVLVIFLLNC